MSQLANYVNFVGVGDGVTDDSAALQTAINTAAAQPFGGVVFVPPCSVGYVIDNIVLKNFVDIIGGGMRQTAFMAKPGSANSVFVLDTGHVLNCRYQNFVVYASPNSFFTATGSGTNLTVSGVSGSPIMPGTQGIDIGVVAGIPANTYIVSQTSGTTGGAGVYVTNQATTISAGACVGISRQHCFNLQATIGGSGDGGLWYSIFKNVFVSGFGGYAWWLRAGPNSFIQPHQFVTFDSCIASRANSNYSRCILLTGQCGQIKFQGVCDFDGSGAQTGTNIELGAEFVNGSLIGGALVGGSAVNGPRTPYNIVFHGVTSQAALTAIYTYNTNDVVIDSCYFEAVAQVIVGSVAYNTLIINSHFTNCGILPTVSALATPVNSAFSTATTGGSLAAGTYSYRVAATNSFGATLASTETSQVVPAGTSTNTVTVNWGAVTGATGYKVYGRTSGIEQLITSVGAVTTYTDTGSIAPVGLPPVVNSTTGGTGFCISMTNGSYATATGNDAYSPDRFIDNASNGLVYSRGNLMASLPAYLDRNFSRPVNSFNNSALDVRYATMCYINFNTTITTINSFHSVGARVSFVNNQGGASVVMTSVGGNITLGSKTNLTLGNLDTALFELSDITGGWQYLGGTGTLS